MTIQSETPRRRVLIAGGRAADAELIGACLGELDVETAFALAGQDTIEQAASFNPDVILLDTTTSDRGSLDLCRRLKNDTATRGMPIVMLIAWNSLGDIEQAVKAGTDDFLSKPVNKAELVQRLRNLLRSLS